MLIITRGHVIGVIARETIEMLTYRFDRSLLFRRLNSMSGRDLAASMREDSRRDSSCAVVAIQDVNPKSVEDSRRGSPPLTCVDARA